MGLQVKRTEKGASRKACAPAIAAKRVVTYSPRFKASSISSNRSSSNSPTSASVLSLKQPASLSPAALIRSASAVASASLLLTISAASSLTYSLEFVPVAPIHPCRSCPAPISPRLIEPLPSKHRIPRPSCQPPASARQGRRLYSGSGS